MTKSVSLVYETRFGKSKNTFIMFNELKSPMFLTNKKLYLEMCFNSRKSPKYKMTDFYINQRKKMDILMTAGNSRQEANGHMMIRIE